MRPSTSFLALAAVAFTAAAVASVTTLLWPGAFPPPPGGDVHGAAAEARGWSAVTLAFAVPVGAVALFGRGIGARLVQLGVLAYLVYTYLEFAVSPPFSPLYLVYVVAFACALPALVLGAFALDAQEVAARFGARAPRRGIAAFALITAVGLALAWGKGIATRMIDGAYGWPTGEDAIGHVVHALDLGLQVPLGLATASLLLARKPAGFVVAAIFLVNAALMGSALVAMVGSSLAVQGQSIVGAAPFVLLPLGALVLAALFFRPHILRLRSTGEPTAFTA